MKKKITIIVFILLIFLLLICYSLLKKGHNIIIKSADDIENYILNIRYYKANVDIVVNSNKNSNTYKAKQESSAEKDIYEQEILSPENIEGIKIKYNDSNLKIENTKFNLSKIYNNYTNIIDYDLNLLDFIEECKTNHNIYEKENKIVIETEIKEENKCKKKKLLYINKSDYKPEKLEIKDINNKTKIYILYNEIEIK